MRHMFNIESSAIVAETPMGADYGNSQLPSNLRFTSRNPEIQKSHVLWRHSPLYVARFLWHRLNCTSITPQRPPRQTMNLDALDFKTWPQIFQ